jgi:hypothetical protein
MSRCKALEIQRKKAYLKGTSLTMDESNAAGGRFSVYEADQKCPDARRSNSRGIRRT